MFVFYVNTQTDLTVEGYEICVLLFQFYIGGVPNKQDGLLVIQNFTGCMENLYLNTTNVVYSIKEATSYGDNYLYEKVNTLYSCPVSNIPIFMVGYETCQKKYVSTVFV
jgi:hypothetical protein